MEKDVIVRGLSKKDLDLLSVLAKQNKKSRNELIVKIIQQYIERDMMSTTHNLYQVYIKEMIQTQNFILEKVQRQDEFLKMVNGRIDKMNDLTAQWLDLNEY